MDYEINQIYKLNTENIPNLKNDNIDQIKEKSEFILKTIESEVENLKAYLAALKLDISNFSKSLIYKLKDFIENVLNMKYLFTYSESRGLIFPGELIQHDKFNKLIQNNSIDSKSTITNKNSIGSNMKLNSNEIDIIKCWENRVNYSHEINLNCFNEYIKHFIDKIKGAERKRLINKNSTSENADNYKRLQEKQAILDLKKQFDNIKNNKDSELFHIGNKDIIEDKLKFLNKEKQAIKSLMEYKEMLIQKKSNLEKRIQPYENIPSDINLLRDLVKKKRLEYQRLEKLKAEIKNK